MSERPLKDAIVGIINDYVEGNALTMEQSADAIISLIGRADESDLLLGQARFLLDRLNDFDDWSQDEDDLLRNWCGHVDPARSRLENTVAAMEAAKSHRADER